MPPGSAPPYRMPSRPTGCQIVVHKWHLVALANQLVTDVRQRVTRVRQWLDSPGCLMSMVRTKEIGAA